MPASPMLEHLRDLLESASSGLPRVGVKKAFGSWGFFVDDTIFALAYSGESRIGVKLLDPARHAALMAIPGAGPWAPHKSPMSSWVLVPESWNDDLDALRPWVREAYELVLATPKDERTKAGRAKKAKSSGGAKTAVTKAVSKKPATKKKR